MVPSVPGQPIDHGAALSALRGVDTKLSTSLDLSDQAKRKILLSCLQNCDARLVEQVNVPLELTDYMAHNIQVANGKGGELVDAVRLVMIDKDGTTYECVADTLVQSLGSLMFAYGQPPWSPPLKVAVRSTQKNTRNIYWFEPLG